MKKWLILIIVIIIVIVIFIINQNFMDEIKKETSSEIKTGETEKEVRACALNLYKEAKDKGMDFVSQCLGNCGDYAVDVIHVPRNEVDNLIENQCKDYREGKVKHFIELDQQGNVYRIV